MNDSASFTRSEQERDQRQRPPIRVAQLVTSLASGGAQATVLDSVDMADQPIEVTVLAGCPGGDRESTLWDDPRLAGVEVIEVPRLVRAVSPINDVLALLWLVRWLRRTRPDVLHTHSSKAGVVGRIAAALAGIPCAHTVHGWGPLHATNRYGAAMALLIERRLASICSAIVVVGGNDLRRGLAQGIGSPGRYRVIRSGVETSIGASSAVDRHMVRAELGLGLDAGADRYVIGMVARMAYPKDHLTLIEAFRLADIDNSELVLIGDGPNRTVVEQAVAAAEMGERIRLLGQRTDAARLVGGFDLAVLSSLWEGMPRSVVEAVAASVPVVACDVGNIGDLLQDGVSGRLVPPGDAEALAAVFVDSHKRQMIYQDMAAVAARRINEFSADKMRHDLATLWLELASADRPAVEVEPSNRTAHDRVRGPAGRQRPSILQR
ncbi:MAG: glycosyltransferase [Acidimicrobiales bacterium]